MRFRCVGLGRQVMTRTRNRVWVAYAVALCGGAVPGQSALNGSDEIALGMSTALTGPVVEPGLNMQACVLAALHEAGMEYRALNEIREHRARTFGPS